MKDQNVYVLTWSDQYGTDAVVYSKRELAEKVVLKIAEEGWEDVLGDEQKPEDKKDLVNRYFWAQENLAVRGESYSIEKTRIITE